MSGSHADRGPSIRGRPWRTGCGTSNTYRSKCFSREPRRYRAESYRYPDGGTAGDRPWRRPRRRQPSGAWVPSWHCPSGPWRLRAKEPSGLERLQLRVGDDHWEFVLALVHLKRDLEISTGERNILPLTSGVNSNKF